MARVKPVAPGTDELRAAIDCCRQRDEELADAVIVLASTGMRRGELLALQWNDVDLANAELHVSAGIVDGGPAVGLLRKPTKRADWRDVPLTAGAVEALQRQRRRSAALGGLAVASGYVFAATGIATAPMRPDTFTDRWAAARGPSPITLQQVRHDAATKMLDAGESYRTVADILGNSENTLRLHYDGLGIPLWSGHLTQAGRPGKESIHHGRFTPAVVAGVQAGRGGVGAFVGPSD